MGSNIIELEHPVTVRIFSDFVCPWCCIGAARFRSALDSVSFSKAVTVEHAPFVLRPDNPEDGIDVMDNLAQKYGPEAAKSMVEGVERAARAEGLDINYSKMGRNYPTFRAHALVLRAAGKGTQDELSVAIMRAHFVEGKNIHDVDTLVELGVAHGFIVDEVKGIVTNAHEIESVRRQAASASRVINGVPYFVFNERVAVSGAQPAHILLQAIERASKTAPRDE